MREIMNPRELVEKILKKAKRPMSCKEIAERYSEVVSNQITAEHIASLFLTKDKLGSHYDVSIDADNLILKLSKWDKKKSKKKHTLKDLEEITKAMGELRL